MAYARVGMYTVKPGTLDGVLKKAEAELVPETQRQPGFRRYFAIRTGPDALTSVTVWESKEQAEQAAERLSGWVRREMGPSLVSVNNHVGEMTMSSVPGGEISGYARITLFDCKPDADIASLTQHAKAEWLPLIERQPGFVGYGAAQTGPDRVVAVTAFATKEQAGAMDGAPGAWVRENLMPSVASVERHEGGIVWGVRAK